MHVLKVASWLRDKRVAPVTSEVISPRHGVYLESLKYLVCTMENARRVLSLSLQVPAICIRLARVFWI